MTKEELETIKTLVRLGDSEELAIKTVLANREKQDTNEFYRNAYTN